MIVACVIFVLKPIFLPPKNKRENGHRNDAHTSNLNQNQDNELSKWGPNSRCVMHNWGPVTQEALVEVNNASKNGAPLPSFVENGSISRQAPINIIVAKLRMIICPVAAAIRLNIKPPILIS